ncbi:TIGR02281 family clan AA aspartic protease [Aliikangiella sp. G2MR2-5]|uniref:retropepsin-like aspartic protease family protein n=1 Tax=Aliikangiella sp. G2MR2-5 TaxID=2788943 RepID=UPI0018A9D78E|nr:TIGR02281 family clan AA aspartic protease [Aliikangiella sp. G2MR2-5]
MGDEVVKILKRKVRLLLLFVSIISTPLCFGQETKAEEEQVQLIALFKNAAMLKYKGKQKLYRNGDKIARNIRLIRADTQSAVIEVNQKKVELKPGGIGRFTKLEDSTPKISGVDSSAASASANVVRILRNSGGMFKTKGFINGIGVPILVDTGASQVAMNESIASQIGLMYKMEGRKIAVSTAAGVVPAWALNLKKVRVGGIELRNVDAMVVKGTGPAEVLLGMSFLSRLKMENDGQVLILTKKY